MSQINDKQQWRSLDHLEQNDSYLKFEHREFQEGASTLEDPISRRTFIKLLGATAAFAGATGCNFRRPTQKIKPYAKMPEEVVPGKANFYATTMNVGEDVVGVLVESHEGRPTKIEGNPSHPSSQGKTKAYQQASILNLYDPDRVQHVTKKGVTQDSHQSLEAMLSDTRSEFAKNGGRGLVILTEAQVSPTFYRLISQIKNRFPFAKIYRYEPINRDNVILGLYSVTKNWVVPEYQFEKANIVVSFDSDFLGNEQGSIVNTRAFTSRRSPESKQGMNRLYIAETRVSQTGALADHKLSLKPSENEGLIYAVLNSLIKKGLRSVYISPNVKKEVEKRAASFSKDKHHQAVLRAMVSDLVANRQKSIVIAGTHLPESSQAAVYLINKLLRNDGRTILYRPLNFSNYSFVRKSSLDSIAEFVDRCSEGQVQAAFIVGGNPVFTSPNDIAIKKALKNVQTTVHLTESENETSAECTWVVPRSHYLESWSDAVSDNGVRSIVQPLIKPLYQSMSDNELISRLIGSGQSGYKLTRETWRNKGLFSDSSWKKWLHNGIISQSKSSVISTGFNTVGLAQIMGDESPSQASADQIEIAFYQDPSIYDGRYSNNGWLQELPDPITKLTWDNAAQISPALAKKQGLKDDDVIQVKANGKTLKLPVKITPGQSDNTLILYVGYGREVVGRVGKGTGFNTYILQASHNSWLAQNAQISKTSETYPLASTQDHGSMEGRVLAVSTTLENYKKHPDFVDHLVEVPHRKSLWPEVKYDTGYQWGMSIDLAKCTGCNACVTACQSENNIPIVGKDQVLNGRELHWIRVDRYFEGDPNDAQVAYQPVNCLQCESAPCEQVCPVAATTHSSEGLNDMTYNRCIGTRYCANNCPAKVRRFNFFDYNQTNPQAVDKTREHVFDYFKEPDKTIQLQFNPDVTVRMRGVMEKCTYCVQRINEGKIDAKNNGELVKDGAIQTACQQSCPADAIIFGNIRDKESEVSKQKELPRNYEILDQLILKARTTYLAAIKNPHPSLDKGHKKEVHGEHHG